jgi:acyl-coenzyme A synthetase/AMP-(fatty) acid ligase
MSENWTTWRASDEDVWPSEDRGPAGPWILHTSDPLLLNAVLRRGLVSGLRLILAPAQWARERVTDAGAVAGARAVLSGSRFAPVWHNIDVHNEPYHAQSYLGLFTSGSAGAPKLVLHEWGRISRPGALAAERLTNARWLMTFSPVSYAGLQVFFAAIAGRGEIIYSKNSFASLRIILERGEVDAISATPTWWRMFVASLPFGLLPRPLRQATLGGEIVDQAIIDTVARVFLPERLTHIYASTEVGSAIAVSDRREGFPAAWLDDTSRQCQLRIREGFLEVRSAFGMKCYANGSEAGGWSWYRTPDRVEIVRGRVLFRGRSDAVVNVGGSKVLLEEVERAVLDLPGVVDCRVYAQASAITGALLSVELVFQQGTEPDVSRLKNALRAILPPPAIPQIWKSVERLAINHNGKKSRS